MDNKNRIIELKKKNEIGRICKIWADNGVLISIDDFLEIKETLCLQSEVLNKLDEIDSKNLSFIYKNKEKDILAIFTDYIKKHLKLNEKYVFFIQKAPKIGGLVLSGNMIIENLGFILNESEIFHNGCSIFFCTQNNEKGVCLWKGEYDIRIYVW